MPKSQYISQIGENAIFQFNQQFTGFKKINSITDFIDGETTEKTITKLISYSLDNEETWSAWKTRTENLQLPIDKDINIRLGYEVSGTPSQTVIEIKEPIIDIEFIKDNIVCCCTCNSSVASKLFANGVNILGTSLITGNTLGTYDPYADMTNEVLFYQAFNQEISQTIGITTLYWRVSPQKRSGDIIFKEWTIIGKEPAKCVKIIVPENQFPDAKINFNIWGADYEFPFEIHIDKISWDTLFPNTMPQQGDVIYIDLADRIYEINSAYLWRGFMAVPLYYKCNLIKHQPKLGDISSQSVQDDIRQFIRTTDEIFGEATQKEELKLTKPLQYDVATIQSDPVRYLINKNLVIEETPIMNDWSLVSKFQYNLTGTSGSAIQYHQNIDFQADRSFACWFRPKMRTDKEVFTNNHVVDNNKVTIYISATSTLKLNQLLEIKNSDTTKNIVSISEIKDGVSFSYIGTKNPTSYRKVYRDNLISGTRSAFEVNVFDNQIEIWMSGQQYLMPYQFQDDWYPLVINASNQYGQLTCNLWQRSLGSKNDLTQFNNGSTQLKMVKEQTWNIQAFSFSSDEKWQLLSGETSITNIRIFNHLVEREKQSLLLNQNIIKDSQYVLLADNALPRLDIVTVSKATQ